MRKNLSLYISSFPAMRSIGLEIFALFLTCFCLGTGIEVCDDDFPTSQCKTYRRDGACRTAPSYMTRKCARTCGFCTGPTKATVADNQCGVSSFQSARIVNGKDAIEGAWPWMVSLQQYRNHRCGGTLLTPRWAITAAHCVHKIAPKYLKLWRVSLGAHDFWNHHDPKVQNIAIKTILKHPLYDDNILHADVALLELAHPALLNDRVKTICLPSKKIYPNIGKTCVQTGWGHTMHPNGGTHNILQQAVIPVVHSSKCKFEQEVVCAGHGRNDSAVGCKGDSGGPLVCQQSDGRWQLEGIASYVVEYCKYYGGFAPVNKYMDWIKNHIEL